MSASWLGDTEIKKKKKLIVNLFFHIKNYEPLVLGFRLLGEDWSSSLLINIFSKNGSSLPHEETYKAFCTILSFTIVVINCMSYALDSHLVVMICEALQNHDRVEGKVSLETAKGACMMMK